MTERAKGNLKIVMASMIAIFFTWLNVKDDLEKQRWVNDNIRAFRNDTTITDELRDNLIKGLRDATPKQLDTLMASTPMEKITMSDNDRMELLRQFIK